MTAFDEELTDLMGVGSAADTHCRVWMRVQGGGPCVLRVRGGSRAERAHPLQLDTNATDADFTYAFTYPDDFVDAPPLEPLTEYGFRLERPDGVQLCAARCETAPSDTTPLPDRFGIAVMSCHQPFADDGSLHPEAERLLVQLNDILDRYEVKRVLLLGDQMYADMPAPRSLFDADHFRRVAPPGRETILDCSEAEVRALYQQRYRIFFNSPGFKRLQSRYACLPIIDDHEIVDNFGSDSEHSEPHYEALGKGALAAAFDYQGARVLPRDSQGAMDFGLRYGPFACYVMDLRSERCVEDDEMQVFGREQRARLASFLEANADAPVFALGLSVPLVHAPDWAAQLGMTLTGEGTDIAERWANPQAHAARKDLLELLSSHQRAHPGQQLVLLGGDVHVGLLTSLRFHSPELRATQLTASALSNSQEGLEGWAAKVAAKLIDVRTIASTGDDIDCDVELAGAGQPTVENPYGGLNVGIVQFQRRAGEGHDVELKLVGVDERDALREVAWKHL